MHNHPCVDSPFWTRAQWPSPFVPSAAFLWNSAAWLSSSQNWRDQSRRIQDLRLLQGTRSPCEHRALRWRGRHKGSSPRRKTGWRLTSSGSAPWDSSLSRQQKPGVCFCHNSLGFLSPVLAPCPGLGRRARQREWWEGLSLSSPWQYPPSAGWRCLPVTERRICCEVVLGTLSSSPRRGGRRSASTSWEGPSS